MRIRDALETQRNPEKAMAKEPRSVSAELLHAAT